MKFLIPLVLLATAAGADPSCPTGPDWADHAAARSLTAPLGLPPVPHPEDNPPTGAKVELGRKLFFDRRLSINKTMSCAMCHVPEQAFVNRELATAVGVEGRSLKRNAPTLLNVAYVDALFHDGRETSLETQFVGPMVASNEMANPSIGHVISLLNDLPDYAPLFDAAFGTRASLDRVGQAMGAYQRSLIAGNSPFDQWHFGGDDSAVSDDAKAGFDLFTGKAGCADCHTIGDTDAMLSDGLFHDTGYGQMREQDRQNPPASVPVQIAPGIVHRLDYSIVKSVSAPREADLGRYEVTEDTADRWTFRTPSLRNVAATAPYMHDGHFGTLSDVIAFYDQGGANMPGQDQRIRPLGLSPTEKHALEAFLRSLTSPDLGCLSDQARILPPDNH